MLTDRRPILLANARLIDPSRDLDTNGDVLIADGVIKDARKGIGAPSPQNVKAQLARWRKVLTPE